MMSRVVQQESDFVLSECRVVQDPPMRMPCLHRPRQLLDICELCSCLAGRLACRVISLGGMIMTIMHVLSLLDY